MDGVMQTVTSTPALLLGWENKGQIAPGFDADITLFRTPDEGALEIVAALSGGEIVYRA